MHIRPTLIVHVNPIFEARNHAELGMTTYSVAPPLVIIWTKLPFSGLSVVSDHLYSSLKIRTPHYHKSTVFQKHPTLSYVYLIAKY